jgi:hypothetical protein
MNIYKEIDRKGLISNLVKEKHLFFRDITPLSIEFKGIVECDDLKINDYFDAIKQYNPEKVTEILSKHSKGVSNIFKNLNHNDIAQEDFQALMNIMKKFMVELNELLESANAPDLIDKIKVFTVQYTIDNNEKKISGFNNCLYEILNYFEKLYNDLKNT